MVKLGGIEDISTIDWYGRVSTIFFFAGCNLRCRYCHNYKLIPMNSGREYTDSEIFQVLDANRPIIDAVVLTGGEPTLQPEELINVCGLAKHLNLDVMLDTNGTKTMVIADLINKGLIDRVALDVKAPLYPLEYGAITGVSDRWIPTSIKETLKLAGEREVELEVRTTVVPNTYAYGKYLLQGWERGII